VFTSLKVATFNVNSVRSRLEVVLEWLNRESPDFLCLQETKVQDADFPLDPFVTAGYRVAFRGQKAHGGVAIVSKHEMEDVRAGLDDGGPLDEARLIRVRVGDVSIVNTYVPQGRDIESPHFQYKLDWLARMRRWFETNYSANELLLWAGDFNVAPDPIDVHDPKRLTKHVDFHPEARAALEHVRQWGFVDVFRMHCAESGKYTYWDYRVPSSLDRNLGWRIDHIWATQPLAQHSTRAWIDLEPRRAQKPSDHTVLAAEFSW